MLTSDIDLGLLAVTDDFRVVLCPSVKEHKEYADLDGVCLNLPADVDKHPNKAALKRHREWAGL